MSTLARPAPLDVAGKGEPFTVNVISAPAIGPFGPVTLACRILLPFDWRRFGPTYVTVVAFVTVTVTSSKSVAFAGSVTVSRIVCVPTPSCHGGRGAGRNLNAVLRPAVGERAAVGIARTRAIQLDARFAVRRRGDTGWRSGAGDRRLVGARAGANREETAVIGCRVRVSVVP